MQKSKPPSVSAARTGSESGGLRSEKRVEVNAVLGESTSSADMFVKLAMSESTGGRFGDLSINGG